MDRTPNAGSMEKGEKLTGYLQKGVSLRHFSKFPGIGTVPVFLDLGD